MNGSARFDVARVAVGAAAIATGGLGRVVRVGVDAARSLPGVERALAALDARGAETLRAADATAERLLRAVLRRVVAAAVQEVDLTALVRDHVDLDAIAEGIDLERILDRVDVDAVAARLDIGPILDRVDVDAVAARVDIGPILDRVDVDAVAARIDVDAVVGRVDLVGLANTVIEGVDLPGLIRESTGSMSTEAVRGVRSQGMHADDAVAGFVGSCSGAGPMPLSSRDE